MSKVSDEQVETALKAFKRKAPKYWMEVRDADLIAQKCLRAALEAVSSIHEAEPVAWRWKWGAEGAWHYGPSRPSFDDPKSPYFGKLDVVEPLYAHPNPISKGVTEPISLKGFGPRIRQALAERNTTLRDLATAIGVDKASASRACQGKSVSMEHFVLLWNWLHEPSPCLSHTAGEIEAGGEVERLTKERDALVAANNEIEINAGITDNGNLWRFWADKARELAGKQNSLITRAEAADKRIAELTEQAFRDGVAYATNCEVTDVDLAWSQSRVRAALSSQPGGGE